MLGGLIEDVRYVFRYQFDGLNAMRILVQGKWILKFESQSGMLSTRFFLVLCCWAGGARTMGMF
jgi:hypothetical protein